MIKKRGIQGFSYERLETMLCVIYKKEINSLTDLIKNADYSIAGMYNAIALLNKLDLIKIENYDGRTKKPILTEKGTLIAESKIKAFEVWNEVLNNDS